VLSADYLRKIKAVITDRHTLSAELDLLCVGGVAKHVALCSKIETQLQAMCEILTTLVSSMGHSEACIATWLDPMSADNRSAEEVHDAMQMTASKPTLATVFKGD